jgi:GTP-binding protein EngB required for normal cell division
MENKAFESETLSKKIYASIRSLENIVNTRKNDKALEVLISEIKGLKDGLNEPLKVAVVGFMKAGKSTLMNALLRGKILYTNHLEATYLETRFEYGETISMTIEMLDGSKIENLSPDDLAAWTAKPKDDDKEAKERIEKVKRVIVKYPREILKQMILIDTPGFGSNDKDIAARANAVTTSKESAAEADGIVYAFQRAPSEKDSKEIDGFRGESANSTPINSLGIFSKVDAYWHATPDKIDDSPYDNASSALNSYRSQLKDKLYDILPVVALCGESAFQMTDEEYEILKKLATLDKDTFYILISNAKLFKTGDDMLGDYNIPVNNEQRQMVFNRFGMYGIYKIVNAIKGGMTKEEIPDYAYNELSGVNDVYNTIKKHFGNLSFPIKITTRLDKIHSAITAVRRSNPDNTELSDICNRALGELISLYDNNHAFTELTLLREFYEYKNDEKNTEKLFFEDEETDKEFLMIIGENGSSAEAKLGFDKPESIAVMRDRADTLIKKWSCIANQLIGGTKCTRRAAEVVVRSLDILYYHLNMLAGDNK